ncbi:hypothetical protein GLYMA_16G076866v4 [Glycine max]|nr:hypothetical protein GLYMA_16G076866v4 [Glycine max]KAH1150430.1 hypothetical protein GYH30_044439 [Glycine max]
MHWLRMTSLLLLTPLFLLLLRLTSRKMMQHGWTTVFGILDHLMKKVLLTNLCWHPMRITLLHDCGKD